MKRKNLFKRVFEDNRFLKVFAVVAAMLLYIIVAMTTNDSRTRIIRGVPVNLDLQSATLTNQRLSLVEDARYYVDIEVNGPLTEVGGLSEASPQLAATVRADHVTEPGSYQLPVIAEYENVGDLPFKIISYSPETIDVTFDRQASKEFAVNPVVKGLNTPPPYVFDRQYANPERVRVTGPEAELSLVNAIEVELDLDEPLTAVHSKELPVILKDIQGNVIDPADHYLTLSATKVQLVINVLKETELPIKVEFLTPPRGFPVDALREYMALSAEALAISGPEAEVDRLTELLLGYVDIKNLRLNDTTYTYPIELPETLRNRENISSISVRFDATTWSSATFHLSDIDVVSAPYDYDVTLLSTRLDNVEFIGEESIISTLTADDIVAEINLSERELSPGQTNYPVKISAPGKGMVWAAGDYSVIIQVTEKE